MQTAASFKDQWRLSTKPSVSGRSWFCFREEPSSIKECSIKSRRELTKFPNFDLAKIRLLFVSQKLKSQI